jgi:hypothetical protein
MYFVMHSLEIKLLFMVVVWMKAHVFAKQEGALLLTNHYQKYGTFCSRFSCQRLSPFYMPNIA